MVGAKPIFFLFRLVACVSIVTSHSPPPASMACADSYTVTWAEHGPLIYTVPSSTSSPNITGVLYTLLTRAVSLCCAHANTTLEWTPAKGSYWEVESGLRDEHIALPVVRDLSVLTVDSLIDTWDYIPVTESPSRWHYQGCT